MHHTARMCVREREADVADQCQCLRASQMSKFSHLQHATEHRTAQQFHREKHHRAIAVKFKYTHDVRMRQQLQRLKFSSQVGEQLRALRDARMQYLDGQSLTARGFQAIFIEGLKHRPGAAVRHHALQAVTTTQDSARLGFARRIQRLRFVAARMRVGLLNACRGDDVARYRNVARRGGITCSGGIALRAGHRAAREHRGPRTPRAFPDPRLGYRRRRARTRQARS